MNRSVIDFITGVETIIPVIPHKRADGAFMWVDEGTTAPDGYYPITEQEAQQLAQPKLASKDERIAEKLQAGGFPTKGHLYYFIENMRTVASLKLGITDAQAHAAGYAGNPMYRQMVDLYTDITDIEAEP